MQLTINRLCGHATLASSHILKTHPEAIREKLTGNIVFHTLSGELIVDISSADGVMLMDFPADPPVAIQSQLDTAEVAKAIGLTKDKIVAIENANALGFNVIEVDQSVDISSLEVKSAALVDPHLILLLMTGCLVPR